MLACARPMEGGVDVWRMVNALTMAMTVAATHITVPLHALSSLVVAQPPRMTVSWFESLLSMVIAAQFQFLSSDRPSCQLAWWCLRHRRAGHFDA